MRVQSALLAVFALALTSCDSRPGTAPDYIDPSQPTTVDKDSGCVYYVVGTSLIPKYRPDGSALCLPTLDAAVRQACAVERDGTPLCKLTGE